MHKIRVLCNSFLLWFLWNLIRYILILSITQNLFPVYGQFFNQAQFDCKRIHPRYCCSTRVRYSCPQLCQAYPCNGPFPLGQPNSQMNRVAPQSQSLFPGLSGFSRVPNLFSNLMPKPSEPNFNLFGTSTGGGGAFSGFNQQGGSWPNLMGPQIGATFGGNQLSRPQSGSQAGGGRANNGWSEFVGTSNGGEAPRPPPSLVLPPPDTAPAKGPEIGPGENMEEENFPESSGGENVEGLPKPGSLPGFASSGNTAVEILSAIDSVSTSLKPWESQTAISNTPHPTLIPWNPNSTPSPPQLPSNSAFLSQLKNGAVDGEIRVGGASSTPQNVSSRKNLSIPPPNFEGFVDELVAIDKNGGESARPNGFTDFHGQSIAAINQGQSGVSPNGFPDSQPAQPTTSNINPKNELSGSSSESPTTSNGFSAAEVQTALQAISKQGPSEGPEPRPPPRPPPILILPPPEPVGFPGETENTQKNMAETNPPDRIDESESNPVDNIPPLPVNPETTWIPLKFNIQPAKLPEIERTTVPITVSSTEMGPAPWSVQNIGHRPEINHGDVVDNMEGNRREDLPLPDSGLPDKMLTLNGNASENIAILGDRIDLVINGAFNTQTLNSLRELLAKNPHVKVSPPIRLLPSTFPPKMARVTTEIPPKQSHLLTTRPTNFPNASALQCGRAPQFKPCLEVAEASSRLLNCCKEKMLPIGCHQLCRYDVTQAEIKKTFEAGRCGIFNVTPFLECASQGKNNIECCRHRNLAAKSGPQCEIFCGASKIGVLGIQHLACQNVIGDLLTCHYSGLRP